MQAEAVLKKLRFNAPQDLEPHFRTAGMSTSFSAKKKAAFTLVFALNKAEAEKLAAIAAPATEYDGVLWLAYPKGTSKIKTDINRNTLWDIFASFNLRPVSNVAIDETWSALRYRPEAEVNK
jgi:hypothetical protein